MKETPENLAIRGAPILFVFLWSTGFIMTKYGMPYAEPLTFLAVRMVLVVAIFCIIAVVLRPPWPNAIETAHSAVAGLLVHGLYLGGVFVALSEGVPAGISALIAGLQPVLISTIANRWLGERVTPLQWFGLALGMIGVLLVLNDRTILVAGSVIGWIASFLSLIGITLGALYQKRYCGAIDWRSGNLIQYVAAAILFAAGAFVFETRIIQWTGEFIFALVWLVVVLSIFAIALMYWLIRRVSATQVASLFYLVPTVTALFAWILFDERLNPLSIAGMVVCAVAVLLVNWRRG